MSDVPTPALLTEAIIALEAQTHEIAEATVNATFEADPEMLQRYSARGPAYCLQDCLYHIRYLVQAVTSQEPALFTDYLLWARSLLISYNVPPCDLDVQVRALAAVIEQKIPQPEQSAFILNCMEPGINRLAAATEDVREREPDLGALQPLAVEYFNALMAGDRRQASQLIMSAVTSGTNIRSIYMDVFQPVQREIGRLWQYNKITVAQEHFCTAVTQHVMSQLYPYLFEGERTGRVMVAASMSGELHELGIRIVADFFEMEGWDTFYLGASTPAEGIISMLQTQRAHLLALSATITPHVEKVASLIQQVRQANLQRVKILVGGYPFNVAPDLWKQVQADAYAADALQAVAIANSLVARQTDAETSQVIFSVLCDRAGNVQRVIRDDLDILAGRDIPVHLHNVVDTASRSKMWRFLSELCESRAATDWTFNVMADGTLQTLHFGGVCADDTIVVVAGKSGENIHRYYEALMDLNSELANAVRDAVKKYSLARRQAPESAGALLREMTELNNELTNTQRELAKRNAQLAELNDEKNRFLGMAAHDLRTPLNVIFGYSELLRDEWSSISDADRVDMLDKIASSGHYMLSLVNGFLDYSRIESGTLQLRLEPSSIVEVINAAVDQVAPLALNKQIRLSMSAEASLPDIKLDYHRMSQVILNLLTNAIKFSPANAEVSVEAILQENQLLVKVSDNGPGIPADELNLLFRPFSRTSVTATGGETSTGMGLLIVKRIVDAHGGQVQVNSTPGEGTTFSVFLPAD